MPYDLFISYSRRDNAQGRITELRDWIEADHRQFTGDGAKGSASSSTPDDIKGMDDWRHRILDAIRDTRLLLVCLSPAYLQTEFCDWEFNEFLKHESARALLGEGVATVYFVEVPGWADKDYEQRAAEWVAELRRRQYFDLRPWFNEGAEALKDAAIKARMEELNRQIRDRLGRIRKTLEAKGNVDRHNERFVGRTFELRRLRELVGLGKVGVLTAVHGLGGMGKTALAVEYAHAFAHEYPGGRWQVRCEGRDDLRVALVSLAGARDLEFEFSDEEKKDLDLAFERVLRELKRRADAATPGRVLLILDNVDRPKLLEPAQTARLPQADWLHLVATTRLGEHELFGKQTDRAFLPVDELPEADALALIESYQPGGRFRDAAERGAAEEIVRLLGRFTLAVETAAVFLGQFADDVTCAGFRDRLKKQGLTGLEGAASATSEGVRHGEKSLSATLAPTLERLGEPERLALAYAALLPPDHVPLPWLRALMAGRFPELGRDAEPGYPDPWQTLAPAVQPAAAPSHRGEGSRRRAAGGPDAPVGAGTGEARRGCRGERPGAGRAGISQGAVGIPLGRLGGARASLGAGAAGGVRMAVAGAGQHRRSLPGQPGGGPAPAPGKVRGGRAAPSAGRWRSTSGAWARTIPTSPQTSTIWRSCSGPRTGRGRPSRSIAGRWRSTSGAWARTIPNVARTSTTWHRCSRPRTGRGRPSRSIAGRWRSTSGASARTIPNVATALNNLAELLRATNRPGEAEPLYRRALAIDERSLGPDHPDVARDLNNLAQLLRATNRPGEAEPLYRRALAIDERSLGPDHLKVARASTTWRGCSGTRTGRGRPSRSVAGRWRLSSRAWARTIPTSPQTSTTWRGCSGPRTGRGRPSRFIAGRWRSTSGAWARTIPTSPETSTTWRSYSRPRTGRGRPSRSIAGRWRSTSGAWARTIPTSPEISTTWRLLLQATNRPGEAEPLSRRMLEIFLKFTSRPATSIPTCARHRQLHRSPRGPGLQPRANPRPTQRDRPPVRNFQHSQ